MTDCDPGAGTATLGGSCDDTTVLCGPGLFCNNNVCIAWCSVTAQDCPIGQSCAGFPSPPGPALIGSTEYGGCL